MHKLESDFNCHYFDPAEVVEALNYTPVQRAYLENLLGEAAHAKINLKVDPVNFTQFIQEEAYLTAKLDLLRSLLHPALPN